MNIKKICYEEQLMGYILSTDDGKSHFLKINSQLKLERLLQLKPDEELRIDGENVRYERFRQETLLTARAVYSSEISLADFIAKEIGHRERATSYFGLLPKLTPGRTGH